MNASENLNKLSSSYTKYSVIGLTQKKIRLKKHFICCCLRKINQSELSTVLVSLFNQDQPIRVHHFLKTVYDFSKTLEKICKVAIKKQLNFLDLLYKNKEKIPIDFLIDENDVDSYFSYNFLDY